MYLYLKSLASSQLSLTGDKGKPSISIPVGETKTVLIQEAVGNTVFCDSCAQFITHGHLEVRYQSPTGHVLTASEMEAVKNGTSFDLDDDGIVDTAEAAVGALVDPMTARGDIIFRNATAPAALPAANAGDVLESGGAGADPFWHTPGTMIDEDAADYIANALMTARGDVIYNGAAGPAALPAGAAGDYLTSGGAGADPSWTTPQHYGDFLGEQAVLANATIRTWIAPGPGNIVSAYARVATAHSGAGGLEHSDIDIQKNGASILAGGTPILVNAAAGTGAVAGALSAVPGVIDFVAGDIFTIIEAYTPDGGGGDTGAGLAADVEYALD